MTEEPDFHDLRSQRARLRLTLKAIADQAGVSPTYVQKLERGEVKSPSPHHLLRLAEAYDYPYGQMMKIAGYFYPDDGLERSVESYSRRLRMLADALSDSELSDLETKLLVKFVRALREDRDAGVDVPVNTLETTLRGYAELTRAEPVPRKNNGSNGHAPLTRLRRAIARQPATS